MAMGSGDFRHSSSLPMTSKSMSVILFRRLRLMLAALVMMDIESYTSPAQSQAFTGAPRALASKGWCETVASENHWGEIVTQDK
jgi:hypothetical protein